MKRLAWWIVGLVVAPAVLLAVIALSLQRWVHGDDFRGFVADQVSQAAGLRVEIGSVDVDVWPLPAVALNAVQVKSSPPLTLERIVARPAWAPLLHRRLEVQTLIVRNAVVPEAAVAAIAAAFQKKPRSADPGTKPHETVHVALPRRVVLEGISWVSAKGTSNAINALATFDDDGLPRTVHVEVKQGNYAGINADIERQAQSPAWSVHAAVGGGTLKGAVKLDSSAPGAFVLDGQMDTANVEVAALTAPSRTLTGRLDAHTTLKADFRDPSAFADALKTETRFTVRTAVLHGLDLAQAVRSVGMNRGGETHLDALAGNVATHGKAVQLNNLVATSGVLAASGNVAMSPAKALSGKITVDLVGGAAGGALGIPLAVGGTLEAPSVTLSKGALVGAALGTLIAPGLGTGSGAKIGDKLGDGLKSLFGK